MIGVRRKASKLELTNYRPKPYRLRETFRVRVVPKPNGLYAFLIAAPNTATTTTTLLTTTTTYYYYYYSTKP